MGGGGRECPPTRVRAPFVTLPPPPRCRRMDAEAYKECLDAYLEGSITGGVDLRPRIGRPPRRPHPLLRLQGRRRPLSTAGEALHRRRGFVLAARGASLPSWGA